MDRGLLEALNGLVELPGLHEICWLVDQPWAPLIVLILVVADVARRKRWLELPAVVVAVILSDLACARVLKPMFARARPCAEWSWIAAPFGCGPSFSMPSCHSMNIFALAMVINRPWAFALALVVALTRTIAGVHYPSDLLAGAVLGIAIGWVIRLGLNSVRLPVSKAKRSPRRPAP